MKRRRVLNFIVLLALVAPLFLGGNAPASAQVPGPGDGGNPLDYYAEKAAKSRERREARVSQAERQAAADRAVSGGFEMEALVGVDAAWGGPAPRYFSHPNYANSPLPTVISDTGGITVTGGIRKFVDKLPWASSADPASTDIPVAVKTELVAPDSTVSDYYEIGIVQYRQKMHTDLPATLLRGYVQLAGTTPCAPGTVELFNENVDTLVAPASTGYCGVTAPTYLGAAIVAQKDRAVRILFRNLLPAGQGGDLFVPTDTSVMGSGMGPDLHGMPEVDPQNPTCGETPKPAGCFTENRANLHLHGGLTPWISDGTPHQWITPASETLAYPDVNLLGDANAPDHDNAVENKGVSVEYVPDMWFDAAGNAIDSCFGELTCAVPGATNNPGPGAQTYYYTNQQSARLLFYHDHSWGITRLGVYVGGAAAYIIQDETEAALLGTGGALEGLGIGIPLVVQDKTFVPSAAQLAVSDETWDSVRWGGEGNLWLPHVYSPAQNPGDVSGVNQFGRWAYGPWFWPPTSQIAYGPVANPYYCGPDGLMADGVTPCSTPCDPDVEVSPGVFQWCEPPLMPGTPYNSMGMEAFHDTPLVNGIAYPTVTLAPQEYRFRVLNAASDRFFNLSFYQADPAAPTEVQLNPVEVADALADPTIHPTPLVGTEGPAWIQIGTEGGFLPAPVVLNAQPTTWVNDPTVFNAGNVDQHSLLLGPAERADVVVDFSAFAGQTLILYNDAPAAFPARDPRYDYYTGNGNYVDTGGAPSTLPGYGPNTRTVMQIVVTGTPVTPVPNHVNAARLAALQAAFAHQPDGSGVFESSQHPIIVGQGEYNSAYFDPAAPPSQRFSINGPLNGTVQIFDTVLTFKTLPQPLTTTLGTLTMTFMPKMIQDEMGEAFDRDYGRMSGMLGLESPNPQAGQQNMILYPFVNPASELINATNLPSAEVPGGVDITPIATADDGSQIWKITHNGVDTHPIHFHLFDVQLLNRVGWDGIIRKPDPNELGWKDTVRISPLEDTIVALRPVIPVTPFDDVIPNSTRPLNPAMPTGSSLMFTNMDMWGAPTDPIVNLWTNFGLEYVWHCHILSHEEMDMMRPISVAQPPASIVDLAAMVTGTGTNRTVTLTWSDTLNETSYTVQRATDPAGPWTDQATLPADQTTFAQVVVASTSPYYYQVIANNMVGYGATAGYSTMTVTGMSNVVEALTPVTVVAPSNLTATAVSATAVRLTWTDNSDNETGFAIERATDGGAFVRIATRLPKIGTGSISYWDTTAVAGTAYEYRVAALDGPLMTSYTNTASVSWAVPAAPTSLTAVLQTATVVRLTWMDNANNESGFAIERATNGGAFVRIATRLDRAGTGFVSYWDRTVVAGNSYAYRVAAVNPVGMSSYSNTANITVP